MKRFLKMNDDALLASNKLDIGIITHVMLRRGQTLTEIKKHRTYLGRADTFEEYLSEYDVRSNARECMNLYNFYIIEHGLRGSDIEHIHHERLLEAMKAVKKQPDRLFDYIEMCQELSWKDLINEIRKARGKTSMPIQKGNLLAPVPFCIICGATPAVQAHWPITDKMGGKFTIPLCAKCHDEYHVKGDVTFYKNYKRKIGEWLARGARL